uniref:Uncharacterized protein n=1 Tax=Meloidogyne hapla TaxID=6305 RepID=A0A1I8BT94_MELHA
MVGSYFLNTLLRKFVSDILHLGPVGLWYVNVAGGVLVNIGAASNTPILYASRQEKQKSWLSLLNKKIILSSEYRRVMDKELHSIFGSYWKIPVPKPPKNLFATTASPNENIKFFNRLNLAKNKALSSSTGPKTARVHPSPIKFLPIVSSN